MNAETMFKEYRNMKAELATIHHQLNNYREVDPEELLVAMSFSKPVGNVNLPTGGVSDKTARIALNYRSATLKINEEWLDFLQQRYKELSTELAFFEYNLTQLDDTLKSVAKDFLLEDMTWDEMTSKYHVSHSMIGKYRKKAINTLNKKYILRDKQRENYRRGENVDV